ncbi:hypothetical protein ES703_37910 [subsurface metagenome]
MARFKKYENLPWWLNNYNHNTLTPTQKEVLELDYYCLTHGTKLSHQQAAAILHRGRHTVYTARRRLAELGLRITEPAKGSFLVGHPIEYQDEAEYLAALRAKGVDPRRFKMKRKSVQKKISLRDISSSQAAEASASEAAEAGVSLPQTPAGLTDRCSGETGGFTVDQERLDKLLWKVEYDRASASISVQGYEPNKTENLARIAADHYIAKRKAERKSRE